MHTSLDGFVAGPKGEMDWINVDQEMFDLAGQRTNESDTALYGRVTYQMMEAYWPTAGEKPAATKHDIEHSTWYNKVTKVVVSGTMKYVDLPRTKIISENIPEEVKKLKQAPGQDILIFGSPSLAHLLISANLIDEYWLFVNPVILAEGIPLFKDAKQKINLKLVKEIPFASSVICLHYEKAQTN